MQETQESRIQPLDWENSLKEDMATHSSILAWEISLDRGSWKPIVHGMAKFDTTEHTQAQYQIKLESQTIAWFYWTLKLELQDNSTQDAQLYLNFR